MTVPRPFLLTILDGWGSRASADGNAIMMANTPTMDHLQSSYPSTTLGASGEDVGLPSGQMGNSEVGHLNIGAGRLVLQDFQRVNHSISRGDFYRNKVLLSAIGHAGAHGSTLHLMGLLSDGGVHSHIEHIFAILEMSREAGLKGSRHTRSLTAVMCRPGAHCNMSMSWGVGQLTVLALSGRSKVDTTRWTGTTVGIGQSWLTMQLFTRRLPLQRPPKRRWSSPTKMVWMTSFWCHG